MSTQDKIRQQLSSDKIVLYMKGTPQFPQCGFSARAAQVLDACGAKFASYNIASDQEMQKGLVEFSTWPTFPQLYINGELVGGCDIMTELYQKGELQKLVAKATG
jgi:monothiol glutaredoxin